MQQRKRNFVRRPTRRFGRSLIAAFSAYFIVTFLSFSFAYAQINPELIEDLQALLQAETLLVRHCSAQETRFHLHVPYAQIVGEKEQTVSELGQILIDFGAQPQLGRENLPVQEQLVSALLFDATAQNNLICRYDELLERYGHAPVRQFLIRGRNRAERHFRLFLIRSQELTIEKIAIAE